MARALCEARAASAPPYAPPDHAGAGRSGYKGVSRHHKKWTAKLKHKGKTYRMGEFDDPVEAPWARDRKAVELHGEYAWLNLPRELRGRIVEVGGVAIARTSARGRLQVRRGGSSLWEW
jgi:hypothetical protein